MNSRESLLNKLLISLFNDILQIEENSLKSIEDKDLSMTEIHTIEAIGIDEQKSMGEVANRLKITLGTLSIGINKLINKGYVKRQRSEEDKRVVVINLTEKGVKAYNIHKEFHKQMVSTMTEGLSQEEEKVLLKSISKLYTFFEDRYKSLR